MLAKLDPSTQEYIRGRNTFAIQPPKDLSQEQPTHCCSHGLPKRHKPHRASSLPFCQLLRRQGVALLVYGVRIVTVFAEQPGPFGQLLGGSLPLLLGLRSSFFVRLLYLPSLLLEK